MSLDSKAGDGPVETKTPGQALLPIDDPNRSLNDSGLPSVMIWAGGDAYDELTMPGVAERSLDLDSCSLAVGIYRAMTDAHMRNIATLGPSSAALAAPAAVAVPEEVRRLSEAATQGHWYGPTFSTDIRAVGALGPPIGMLSPAGDSNGLNDRAFIIAAVNFVRDLLATPPSGRAPEGGEAYLKQRRDFWLGEAQRLAELVRSLGGDPEPSAPTPPASAGAAPAGWRLVPVEPTAEMVEAYLPVYDRDHMREVIRAIYSAMLAAAPTPADAEAREGRS